MNFFEFSQKIANPAVSSADNGQDPAMDKNTYLRLMSKLSQKLHEKSNKYTPLVRYVARNPEMLSLFEQLIEETSMAQQGQVRNLFK